ncbi:MAG: proteasome accessory factor PafA2 family protein [Candidatus Omnitrophica bacterium]|nr:proteasome accessory factor PafA2 family protein [Candidatus Omnitrophota bacterium]
MNRIVGLETEYGCLTSDPAGPPGIVGRVRNWIFEKGRFGLADLHQRDWDEPAGNGGFLFNGGRAYVDMGHLEHCTPECLSLIDLLRYDRAGDAILLSALKGLRVADHVSFIRNNVDYYSGATFGCHENYLVHRFAPLTEANVLSLLTFLTLRLLYAGAGRVGATPGAELRGEQVKRNADPYFQISQRADYINNDLFEWVQFNRAIINTRDEPLADGRMYRRLHLLHGDTNVLPTSLLLKVGTTALVLDLLELGHLPKIVLADSVMTFRSLSHQPDGPWLVMLADRRQMDAVELLLEYYEMARSEFQGRDAETNVLLNIWKNTLIDLAKRPDALIGRVDWITKRWLFQQFIASEKVSWNDPWLKSQSLEFHNIDPARSLGLALERTPSEWTVSADDVVKASWQPPVNTRAQARSRFMRLLRNKTVRYFVDWEVIDVEGLNSLNLLNPFDPDPPEAEAWARQLSNVLGAVSFP